MENTMIMQKLKSVLNYLVTEDLKATPFNIYFLLIGFSYFITHASFLSWVSMVLITFVGCILNEVLVKILNPDEGEGSEND